jgi:hypothetical protein
MQTEECTCESAVAFSSLVFFENDRNNQTNENAQEEVSVLIRV